MSNYFQNFHKHTSLSHRYNKDSPLVPMDYFKFYAENYSNKGIPQIYSTVEHGYQGNYFHIYDDLEKFNKEQAEKNPNYCPIKFVFGTEAYWVKDRFEKDSSNCHIVLLAKNDNGRKKLNRAIYESFASGYYYKNRMDLDILLSLPKDDIFVSTACLAFWGYDKNDFSFKQTDEVVLKLANHFTDFYLEVQAHDVEAQKKINKHILTLHRKYNIPIIASTDSHVITNDQLADRDDLLRSNKITYEEEEGFCLDCPLYDELVERFKKQGVLTDEEIYEALENTNKTLEFEDIILDRSLKVPVPIMYRDKTQEERNQILKDIVKKEWNKQKNDIDRSRIDEYKKEIQYNVSEIIGCNMADYFLLNYWVMKIGQEKYGGILTPSGRGSGVSFYLNKILGFTKVDKINSDVVMYAERFLTKERILEAHTPPDIDHNVSDREPFKLAQEEVLGVKSYDLLALGTLHYKSAFKMYSRAYNLDPQIANEVSKQIAKYEKAIQHAEEDERDSISIYDYVDKDKYGELIAGCQQYMGIVDNIKSHPCFPKDTLVLTDNGYKNIQDIIIGDNVLTIDNEYHKVVNTMQSKSSNIYEVNLQGSHNFNVTGNHPFFTAQRKYKNISTPKGINRRELINYQWKEVKDLTKNDMVAVAINKNSILPNLEFIDSSNENFWWLVGRWFGDGWISHTIRKSGKRKGDLVKEIVICCDKTTELEKNEIIKHIENLGLNYRVSLEATTYKIYITKCKGLYEWLTQFGHGAINKHLTKDILNLPITQLREFLQGYFSADGHYNVQRKYVRFSSISKELIYGISECIAKAYHRPCSIYLCKKNKTEIIENRICNVHDKYTGTFTYDNRKQDRAFYSNDYIWYNINSITKQEERETDVYNFEVEDNHTYTVYNYVVHNCGTMAYSGDVIEDIGVIMVKSESTKRECFVALQESSTIDYFGYLKQDYLIVDSIGLTYDIYKEIGIEPFTVNQLLEKIKGDKPTWDIYANGYTICINQCEQEKSTQKVMRYKPQNISELCQFVAGIRPSFQTMYKTFEAREHFDYGIKTFDDLIQNEFCPSSFILYQEDLMKVLGFAKFPMSDTYTIIKAISKKKKKVIDSAKEKFVPNFAQAILDTKETDNKKEATDMAETVWTIIENSASYGFNASHSYCMAIDSVTLAYLKAHYPLEFYKVCLQRYTKKGDKDKVTKLKKEMSKMGVKLTPIKYGDDNRDFSINRETNSISQTMASIKDMQKIVPDILYEIGLKHYKNLLCVFRDILKTNINKTSLEILIELDYFKDFGDINYVKNMLEVYKQVAEIKEKLSTCKQLSKEYCESLNIPLNDFRKCAGKETEKIFKELDNEKLVKLFLHYYPSLIEKFKKEYDFTPSTDLDKIRYEINRLGYTDIRIEGCPYFVVEDAEINQYGTPYLKLYGINSGESEVYKVTKQWFLEYPCDVGDILKCVFDVKEKKRKEEYVEIEDGEEVKKSMWINTGEYQNYLKVYNKI